MLSAIYSSSHAVINAKKQIIWHGSIHGESKSAACVAECKLCRSLSGIIRHETCKA